MDADRSSVYYAMELQFEYFGRRAKGEEQVGW